MTLLTIYLDLKTSMPLKETLLLEDFRRIMQDLGCPDIRVIKESRITLEDPEVEAKIGMINFRSVKILSVTCVIQFLHSSLI